MVKLVVDLNKCQSYGQCVFAAPMVFRFHDEESLEFDYTPDDALRGEVERAAAACPVQAILLGNSREEMALAYPSPDRATREQTMRGLSDAQ